MGREGWDEGSHRWLPAGTQKKRDGGGTEGDGGGNEGDGGELDGGKMEGGVKNVGEKFGWC